MNLAQFLLEDKVLSLRDSDGRPVSEATSGEEHFSPCPYSDKRHGYPMNVPALRQMTGQWEHVLDWVSPKRGENSKLRDSLAVALFATVEPMIYKLENPELVIPSEMSIRYKACLGFCQVLTYLIWNDLDPSEARLADFGTADEFFVWLDRERWLLGQVQACPGPRTMIQQLFTRFCSARPKVHQSVVVERVLELVALQSVHVLAAHKNEGSLAHQLFHRGQSPWLFALIQNPDRDPAEVSKFFSDLELPVKVQTLLERPTDEGLFLELHNA